MRIRNVTYTHTMDGEVLGWVPHLHIYPIYPMDLGGDGKFTNGKRKK